MEILGSLLGLLHEVGKLINFERQKQTQDRIKELRELYDLEVSKGSSRDDALIHSIRIELRDICELYRAELKGQSDKD